MCSHIMTHKLPAYTSSSTSPTATTTGSRCNRSLHQQHPATSGTHIIVNSSDPQDLVQELIKRSCTTAYLTGLGRWATHVLPIWVTRRRVGAGYVLPN